MNGPTRRDLLRTAGIGAAGWLSPVARLLARDDDRRARAVIVLWLAGGPSQLETFDPHPGGRIAGGTRAIKTAAPGIELAAGLERTAEQMGRIALVRSVVSKEADHERATYTMKTGWRPDPTVTHPSIGAVICHERSDPAVEIPRHVSILPDQWAARGGYLGAAFDAFQTGDPIEPIPDLLQRVGPERREARRAGLEAVESAFARGRRPDLESRTTLHRDAMRRAERMMTSEQVKAFDVGSVPARERLAFGDTPFGRGCLAAMRLVEAGVRCVEVTLGGWDSHVNNHEVHAGRVRVLDPALAALVAALGERGLLERTVVLCGGEFGRTPEINVADGRDHWPHGFSVAIAGGGIRGGRAVGSTDPTGRSEEPEAPVRVEDVHATVLEALGIDFEKELVTPVGRPLALSEGRVVRELLAKP
jgi:uncharacterized protein (DUF1501 family)